MRTIARIFKRQPRYVGAHVPGAPIRPLGPPVDPWPDAPLTPANNITGEDAVWAPTMVLYVIAPN